MAQSAWLYQVWEALPRILQTNVQLPPPLVDVYARPLPGGVTVLLISILIILGFHPSVGTQLPMHSDKVLHFLGFFAISTSFYWSFYVPDERLHRIWLWRNVSAVLTGAVWLSASIFSEVIQGLLPYKTFQVGDIIANILGTCAAVFVARTIDLQARRNRESAGLYLPDDEEQLMEDPYE